MTAPRKPETFAGKPCQTCGCSIRYKANGKCLTCAAQRGCDRTEASRRRPRTAQEVAAFLDAVAACYCDANYGLADRDNEGASTVCCASKQANMRRQQERIASP